MKQGKMHYLNFRTLCAWSFMVLFLAALLGYLIYEKIRGNGAGWFPVIFGGCLLVLGICYAVVEIWLPYRRIEKRIELFLDGYTTSNLVGEDGDPHFSGAGESGQQNAVSDAVTGDAEPE